MATPHYLRPCFRYLCTSQKQICSFWNRSCTFVDFLIIYVFFGNDEQVWLVFASNDSQIKACRNFCDRWCLDHWVRLTLLYGLFMCGYFSLWLLWLYDVWCKLSNWEECGRYKAWGTLLAHQLVDRNIIVACVDYRCFYFLLWFCSCLYWWVQDVNVHRV